MTQDKTVAQLKFACAAVIGFGLLGLPAALAGTWWPEQAFIDLAFWPFDGKPASHVPEERLLWAILNGIVIGWGILLWQVVTQVYPRDPLGTRRMILISIGAWFIIDSAGSAAAGAPFNAVLNLGFLTLFYVPLLLAGNDAAT